MASALLVSDYVVFMFTSSSCMPQNLIYYVHWDYTCVHTQWAYCIWAHTATTGHLDPLMAEGFTASDAGLIECG